MTFITQVFQYTHTIFASLLTRYVSFDGGASKRVLNFPSHFRHQPRVRGCDVNILLHNNYRIFRLIQPDNIHARP
jgi:hypothetical protein